MRSIGRILRNTLSVLLLLALAAGAVWLITQSRPRPVPAAPVQQSPLATPTPTTQRTLSYTQPNTDPSHTANSTHPHAICRQSGQCHSHPRPPFQRALDAVGPSGRLFHRHL